MAKSPIDIESLSGRLADVGLVLFGRFSLSQDHCATGREHHAGSETVLIGNAGPSMWQVFSQSAQYGDGLPDPMNRWTRAQIEPLAKELGAVAIYPFDEPYWPFQRFAVAATGMKQSPLGLLIHPEYGLWQAFRTAILFAESGEIPSQFKELSGDAEEVIHPCDTCLAKPCLSACPVGAFDGESLNVDPCFGHLASGEDPDCMATGCRARIACPVGQSFKYSRSQINFHMRHYFAN